MGNTSKIMQKRILANAGQIGMSDAIRLVGYAELESWLDGVRTGKIKGFNVGCGAIRLAERG